jgi:hypothetical protein
VLLVVGAVRTLGRIDPTPLHALADN